MAIPWPTTLPAPRSTLQLQTPTSVVRRSTQSGRDELRRFGVAVDDMWDAEFRCFGDAAPAFIRFYDLNANMGLNWINAPWLQIMGYFQHLVRIVGYPKRVGRGELYSDFQCRLAVRLAADAWPDTMWPGER